MLNIVKELKNENNNLYALVRDLENEIIKLKTENTRLEKENESLTDRILELTERLQTQWTTISNQNKNINEVFAKKIVSLLNSLDDKISD